MAVTSSIVIIGSGLAGYSLVKELRQLDSAIPITLITADRGDYYSKPQLSTALAAGRDAAQLVMNTAVQMAEKFNITVLTHTIIKHIDCDAKKVMWHQGELIYDRLVLAVGADVIHLPLTGNAVNTVMSVNTLEDYEIFRESLVGKKSIAVLGSGLVGCEFTNDLSQVNNRVDVISPDLYPLARFVPEIIGRIFQKTLSELGVSWHLESYPVSVNHHEQGYEVALNNGRLIQVESVFSAVGLRARTLLAAQVGLRVSQGIVVDRYLRTSDAAVYALGDCADVEGVMLQYIAPLLACSRALAKTLTGTPTAVHYPPMPIMLKAPACAINLLPPKKGMQGSWIFEGEAPNMEAGFYDAQHILRGFALSGDMLQKRAFYLKHMNTVLPHS